MDWKSADPGVDQRYPGISATPAFPTPGVRAFPKMIDASGAECLPLGRLRASRRRNPAFGPLCLHETDRRPFPRPPVPGRSRVCPPRPAGGRRNRQLALNVAALLVGTIFCFPEPAGRRRHIIGNDGDRNSGECVPPSSILTWDRVGTSPGLCLTPPTGTRSRPMESVWRA